MAGPTCDQPEFGPKGGAQGSALDVIPFFLRPILPVEPMFEFPTRCGGSHRDR